MAVFPSGEQPAPYSLASRNGSRRDYPALVSTRRSIPDPRGDTSSATATVAAPVVPLENHSRLGNMSVPLSTCTTIPDRMARWVT